MRETFAFYTFPILSLHNPNPILSRDTRMPEFFTCGSTGHLIPSPERERVAVIFSLFQEKDWKKPAHFKNCVAPPIVAQTAQPPARAIGDERRARNLIVLQRIVGTVFIVRSAVNGIFFLLVFASSLLSTRWCAFQTQCTTRRVRLFVVFQHYVFWTNCTYRLPYWFGKQSLPRSPLPLSWFIGAPWPCKPWLFLIVCWEILLGKLHGFWVFRRNHVGSVLMVFNRSYLVIEVFNICTYIAMQYIYRSTRA